MIRLTLSAALALAVAACGTAQQPQPLDMTNPQTVINTATALCRQGAPLLAAAALIPDPRIALAAAGVNAICGPLLAGAVPATVDSATPAQIAGGLAELQKLLVASAAAAP